MVVAADYHCYAHYVNLFNVIIMISMVIIVSIIVTLEERGQKATPDALQ